LGVVVTATKIVAIDVLAYRSDRRTLETRDDSAYVVSCEHRDPFGAAVLFKRGRRAARRPNR
jgi:hypothetical protein